MISFETIFIFFFSFSVAWLTLNLKFGCSLTFFLYLNGKLNIPCPCDVYLNPVVKYDSSASPAFSHSLHTDYSHTRNMSTDSYFSQVPWILKSKANSTSISLILTYSSTLYGLCCSTLAAVLAATAEASSCSKYRQYCLWVGRLGGSYASKHRSA